MNKIVSKKGYTSPTYSLISLDSTAALVLLSPPTDDTEDTFGVNASANVDMGNQRISPFSSNEIMTVDTYTSSSPFGNSGSPF